MPSEYEALVAALKLTEIPFAEYGWKKPPDSSAYGVVSLDFEAGTFDGDGAKQDRAYEGSVDLFYQKLANRAELMEAVEETLTEILGNSWELNSIQHETNPDLFHVEWVFQCVHNDTPDAGGGS